MTSGYASSQTGTGRAYLAGTAFMRLEYFDVVNDHDDGTDDEFKFDFYVDPNGNNDGYQFVQTLGYTRDGPFTQNWGNGGPTTSGMARPGTSPRMDVKVAVWEDDTGWGGGREAVSTHYFTDVLQSEDIDGQDYYADGAPDSEGGNNTLRTSINGVTGQIGKTRLVTFGFDKALIQSRHRTGYRGQPGNGTHYSRSDNTWVDIGTHANNKGTVESETIARMRLLTSTTARFDLQYWEDDGGWSGRDGGNQYTTSIGVSSIPAGRTNYSGTSHGDWDGYWYLVGDA